MRKIIILFIVSILLTCSNPVYLRYYHLTLYENGAVVKEYDKVTNLYCESGACSFSYQKQKYKIHMDFIAEPIPEPQK
jgi:hypothetical protein